MTRQHNGQSMANGRGHPDELFLAGYLDGTLSAEERRWVESHLDLCGDCRAAVVSVASVVDAHAAAEAARAHRKRRWPAVGGIAAAAVLAAVLLYNPDSSDVIDRVRTVRSGEDLSQVEVVEPADYATVARSATTLTWRSASAPSYTVFVMDTAGTLVWSTQLPDTSVLVPASALRDGRTYFWYADAIADRVVATTSVRRFHTMR